MHRLRSYLKGGFVDGGGRQGVLLDPATEEEVAELADGPFDAAGALSWARERGGPALAEMTFAQRGEMLRQMSRVVHAHRDELLALAVRNAGNTRGDAKFDVDGASGTLGFYADLGQTLGAARFLLDGEPAQLGRSARFFGQHVWTPRAGAAVFVNAFNFPAWGIAEKAACALLAGMPVVAKPATATAVTACRMVELWLEAKCLPEGALQLLIGRTDGLLEALGGHDVLAFTGSSQTAALLRGHPHVVANGVHVNVEADSLNAAVLGPDVEPGGDTWGLFLADVARDMTQKTGQKCTAIRRVFLPPASLERAREELAERLAAVKVGNPASDEVTMGPVATARQREDVRAGIARLSAEAEVVFGGDGAVAAPIGAPAGKGFFVGPVLLAAADGAAVHAMHEHEVFGPVATLAPAASAKDAAALVRRGGGGLVCSVYSDDRAWLAEIVAGVAAHHGRVYVGSAKVAAQNPGPGTALPQLLHGGPGRAGGGEELGAQRGMSLYMQRVALEGDKALLDAIVKA